MFSVIMELSPLPLLKFALVLSLISKLMVTYLDDKMLSFSCSGFACVFQLCAEMPGFYDYSGKWVWPSGEPEEWEET
jgi:hypothetical protein